MGRVGGVRCLGNSLKKEGFYGSFPYYAVKIFKGETHPRLLTEAGLMVATQ